MAAPDTDRLKALIAAEQKADALFGAIEAAGLIAPGRTEVLRRPEPFRSVQQLISGVGGVRFPRMNRSIKAMPRVNFSERVHMVRHHAPRNQGAALAIEVQQGVLRQFRDLGIGQIAAAISFVKRSIGRSDTLITRLSGEFIPKAIW